MSEHKVFMTALNFKTFLGMVRVDGPPEWASGEGRYVLEADYKALEAVLRGLYEDNVDYLTLNHLGGMNNHWLKAAREVLGITVPETKVTP